MCLLGSQGRGRFRIWHRNVPGSRRNAVAQRERRGLSSIGINPAWGSGLRPRGEFLSVDSL